MTEPTQLLFAASVLAAFRSAIWLLFFIAAPQPACAYKGWLADNPAQHGEHYELVSCLACGGQHLVNTTTGKTLADEDKD